MFEMKMEEENGVEEVTVGAVFKADPDGRGSTEGEGGDNNSGFQYEQHLPGETSSNHEEEGDGNCEESWTGDQRTWGSMEEEIRKLQGELEAERRGKKEVEVKLEAERRGKEEVEVKLEAERRGKEEVEVKLETEMRGREEVDKILEKLVNFIIYSHGEFGLLLKRLVSITNKNLEVANFLELGPFHDENEADGFLDLITSLGGKFLNEFENLGETRNLLERANGILKVAVPNPAAYSTTSEDDDDGNYSNYTGNSSSSTLDLNPSSSADTVMKMPSSSASQAGNVKELSLWKVKKSRGISAQAGVNRGMNVCYKNRKHGYDRSKNLGGYYCLCGRKCRSAKTLYVHVRYYTTVWKFQCGICSRRFLYATNLKQHYISKHQMVDLATSPVSCSTCGEGFEDWTTCSKHIRRAHGKISSGDGNIGLQSSSPSTQGFGTVKKRKRASRILGPGHTSKDHGVNQQSVLHRCLCGNVYSRKEALMMHIRSREYGRIFKCPVCLKGFFVHQDLKTHVRVVHKTEYQQGNYGCTFCGATFETQNQLRIHRVAVHANIGTGSMERETYRTGQQGTSASPGNDDVEEIDSTEADSIELVASIPEPSSYTGYYASPIISPRNHPQPFTTSSVVSSNNGDDDIELICID